MYSYEDRIRAVELYIKLGKRVRATIRQLGYPTKNALKGWHRECDQRLDFACGLCGPSPQVLAGAEGGGCRALHHSRSLHCRNDACIGLSRSWDVDRMGSRGAA